MIFDTLVENDDNSRRFFHFVDIFFCQAFRGVKGQKSCPE